MFTPLAQLSLTLKIRQNYLTNGVGYLSDDEIIVNLFTPSPFPYCESGILLFKVMVTLSV